MERLPAKPLLITRSLAVTSAVGLAAAYIIFAQVNAVKEKSVPLPVPPVPKEDAMRLRDSQIGPTSGLSSEVGTILQTSSKSGVLAREAAIITGDLMSFGPISLNKSTPGPTLRPEYLGHSTKTSVIKREAEEFISVAGMKFLPPTATIPPVPRIPNAPPTGVAPLILPVATPLPAAR